VELKVQVGMQAPMMQHQKQMEHNHGDHKHWSASQLCQLAAGWVLV
jgi:hypothetical protein